MRLDSEGAPGKVALGILAAGRVFDPVGGDGRVRFNRRAGQSAVNDRKANQSLADFLECRLRLMATTTFLPPAEWHDECSSKNRNDEQDDCEFGEREPSCVLESADCRQ